jgi:hypothetical protein
VDRGHRTQPRAAIGRESNGRESTAVGGDETSRAHWLGAAAPTVTKIESPIGARTATGGGRPSNLG